MGRFALVVALLSLPAFAQGVVKGTVTVKDVGADGKAVARADRSGIVVYIPDFDEPTPQRPMPVMAQKNKQFVPQVLPIVKGETVDFVNEDEILHNVFSNSHAAGFKGFDLGKYRGVKHKEVPFSKTGIVDVYCDIHEAMVGSVLVLPNRAYAVTDATGHFRIDHVPPGHHVIYAFARHAERASADLDVKASEPANVSLEVTVTQQGDEHPDRHGESYAKHPKDYGDH